MMQDSKEMSYAGNPHGRFGEMEIVPAVKPRRGSLLCKNVIVLLVSLVLTVIANAELAKIVDGNWTYHRIGGNGVGWNAYLVSLKTDVSGAVTIPKALNYNDTPYKAESGCFANCAAITSISLASLPGQSSLDAEMFKNCSKLTTVTLPNVDSIGSSAFYGCSSLQSIEAPNSSSIPTTVKTIGEKAFYGCSSLRTIVLPSNLTAIGQMAFSGCTALTSVSIPNKVTSVEAQVFIQCSGLTSLTMGNGVKSIGDYAFMGCSKVKNLSFPASVESIGTGAFYNWRGISSLTIPSRVKTIGSQAFSGCTGLTTIHIPSNVTSIGASAFSGCTGLTTIHIPSNVTSIGASAFSGCSKLRTAFVPETLSDSIDSSVFSGCASDFTLYFYNVAGYGNKSPNPPMAKNNNISITPTTRSFGVDGGGNAIITSGSGTWTAAVSDPWIVLNATSGTVGYPVAYTVSANTNAEQRTGYVYVSGWTHTVTQDGVGGTISPENTSVEKDTIVGTINVSVPSKIVWHAYPEVDWIHVSPSSGSGNGTVKYMVDSFDEVSTRQGTLTVAGNTFTVFQYGRRIKLDSYSTSQNYETHVIPITVNALAITQWSVTPNNSWISVVDAGNGQGGDLVTIAIAENPSYKARTGTVKIGTETFTVTQQGRPTAALSFNVSPANSTASVEGANGTIAVTATPDLPWTATSGANWLTVYAATANGAGNGNVVYSASPNPTLSKRTGKITVTPEAASGVAAKTHTVTQPAATAALSSSGYEFVAAGESCSVEVSCASIVQWSISESLDWLTVNGSTSRTGPGTVVLQAAANNTVYPRSGKVTIAGKTFSVSQKARGVELEYDTKLFGTDGGSESISIHPDGNVSWTAVASDPSWITIFQGDSGTGDGEILYIVSPYVGNGEARTGWITIGDKKVYITQRAYELSISPNGSVVKGNNGAGEFGVSANIGAVWTAIVTEPWITIVSGYDAGTGSGTVRFICEDNNTGKPRVGKIVVAGEVYTITQSERILVQIQATAGRGGSLTGSGTYDKGEKIVLTAVPDSGYQFVRWTGPVSSTDNPLVMDADDIVGIRAEFEPMPIDFTAVSSSIDGVDLSWNTLAWAMTYRLYRGESDDIAAAAEVATFLNGAVGAYRDETGVRGVTYWYWVAAIGDEDEVVSMSASGMRKPIVNSPITYENLMGATHSNPDTYVEGREVTFSHPSTLRGYTFSGWTPPKITKKMTGAQKVRANWAANRYSIVYNANGGSGTMPPVDATYDVEVKAATSGFTMEGHTLVGWATNAEDMVVSFLPDQPMTNLTDVSGGEVNMYAVWRVNSYTVTFNANGGTGGKTVTQNYGTALAAPTVTRTGYTFAGWSPAVPATVPAGNATYVAQWTKNQYTVTFNANGGDGGWSKSMDYGATITAPTVTRTGYTFTGWSPAVAATVPNGNVTYTAQWKINQYTVTFNANGGDGGWSKSMDYGATITAPTVTRTGYTFTGWSPAVPATVQAGNATYVAQWTKDKYTVMFDLNGGEGIGNDGTVWYVNGTSGSDSNSGTSQTSAKRTIQVAIDAADEGDTILVAPGTYAPVTTDNKAITIRGTAGASSTIIDGDDSSRCAYLGEDSGEIATILDGFTLTNGYVYVSTTGIGGAGVRGGTVRNCIICDCMVKGLWSGYGGEGGGAYGSQLERCEIRGCSALVGGGLRSGAAYECVFEDNYARDDGGATHGSLSVNCLMKGNYAYNTGGQGAGAAGCDVTNINCTIVENHARSGGIFAGNSELKNCIVCDNIVDEGKLIYTDSEASTRVLCSYTSSSPRFVDAASGDYRLAAGSPFIDAGDNSYVTGDTDLAGNARIANGKVDIGCYEYGSTAVDDTLLVGGMKIEREYDEELGALPTPVRTGYTFDGWYTAADGGEKINASTKVMGNVTYYAHWTINQYKVTFNANGGMGGKTVTQDYGTSLAVPTVTRTGYTFAGWSPAVPATVPAENATYVAQWTKNKYTVTFNANGGDGGWSKSMDYGATITAPTVTRTGYTFTGWSPAVAATVPTGNVTYTAQWIVNQYTVTFNANGGNGGKTVTQNYGTELVAPTVTRTGYTFAGWSPAVPATVLAANATYTAQWTKNKYTVTFNANGGNGGWSKSMDYGATITAPTVTRTGYTFLGWSPAVPSTVPAANATYTAQWTANGYSIAYDPNGGTGTMDATAMTYDMEGVVSSNDFTRVGYRFVGWAIEPDGAVVYEAGELVSNLTAQSGDVLTLYAVWEEIRWPITYMNLRGASNQNPATYQEGTAVAFNSPGAVEGYIFVGWTPSAITEDAVGPQTVTANWTANKYTIKFYANGGKGTMKTLSAIYDKSVRLTANAFKRTGYKFAGWAKSKSGAVAYKDKASVKNLTVANGKTVALYAVWKPCSYKIKFNRNGGKGTMNTLSATYGKNVRLTANAFKRTGYKFAGWAKKKNGKVAYKNKAKVKNLTATNGKTITLYAVWKKAKSGDVKAAATAAKPAAAVAAVPAWAVGTFYGGDEGASTTITVSKVGKVSGKVLFENGGRWTIVGKASGQRIAAVVTDADGNSAEVAFAIVKTPDGRCRIESADGSMWAE